jgi:hypothetical protein
MPDKYDDAANFVYAAAEAHMTEQAWDRLHAAAARALRSVAEEERETCASVCDEWASRYLRAAARARSASMRQGRMAIHAEASGCAAAIRSRSTSEPTT